MDGIQLLWTVVIVTARMFQLSEMTSRFDDITWTLTSSGAPASRLKIGNLLQCVKMCKYINNCQHVTYAVFNRECMFHSNVTWESLTHVEARYTEIYKNSRDRMAHSGIAPDASPCDTTSCAQTSQCVQSGTSFSCLKMFQCPATYNITHGSYVSDGSSILSERHFRCDDGYVLIGQESGTCLADGTWDNLPPVCQTECGIPPAIENAKVAYSDTLYLSRAVYTCLDQTGFSGIFKTRVATCGSDGSWRGVEEECVTLDVVYIDDWILLFRVTEEIGTFSYSVWSNDSLYHDHPGLRHDVMPGCRTLNSSNTCDIHFKSKLLNLPFNEMFSEFKVALMKEGQEMASIVFSGQDADKESWFSRENIVSSPWDDLKTEFSNAFSIKGNTPSWEWSTEVDYTTIIPLSDTSGTTSSFLDSYRPIKLYLLNASKAFVMH